MMAMAMMGKLASGEECEFEEEEGLLTRSGGEGGGCCDPMLLIMGSISMDDNGQRFVRRKIGRWGLFCLDLG